MKIERTINGINFKFELLPDELTEAYFEQQKKFDIENIIEYAESMSPTELEDTYGCTYQEYLSQKEDIADVLRENLDMGASFQAAIDYAIDIVMKNNVLAM